MLARTERDVTGARDGARNPLAELYLATGPTVARGLLDSEDKEASMQIPYDLEFVENRPLVRVAARVGNRAPIRSEAALPPAHDAIDRLLQWAFRILRRFESHN